MKTYEPYVKCLASMDERQAAWDTSSPGFEHREMSFEEISAMDVSLNSMKVYTLEIRSSVMFRDIIFSLRPIQGWAQSTRSAPMNRDTMRISEEYFHFKDDDDKITEMIRRVGEGESRDSVRDLLTTTISTVYTITIDHRVVMAFCKSLEALNVDLFGLYGVMILRAINGRSAYIDSTVHPIHPFCQITDAERKNERTEKAGNMIFGYYNMKCAMASQFLRQHYSKIKIGYWDYIPEFFETSLSQSDKIDVAFYIDEASYSRLMSLRSHWNLDWSMDMWGPLVSDFTKNMSIEEFWYFLPNGGGKKDPYWSSTYNRVLRHDPGLPCPIMCEWPAMIDAREKEIGSNPVIDRYKSLAKAELIRDNPNNKHRQLYLSTGEAP